jgi:hypothetical protein
MRAICRDRNYACRTTGKPPAPGCMTLSDDDDDDGESDDDEDQIV